MNWDIDAGCPREEGSSENTNRGVAAETVGRLLEGGAEQTRDSMRTYTSVKSSTYLIYMWIFEFWVRSQVGNVLSIVNVNSRPEPPDVAQPNLRLTF